MIKKGDSVFGFKERQAFLSFTLSSDFLNEWTTIEKSWKPKSTQMKAPQRGLLVVVKTVIEAPNKQARVPVLLLFFLPPPTKNLRAAPKIEVTRPKKNKHAASRRAALFSASSVASIGLWIISSASGAAAQLNWPQSRLYFSPPRKFSHPANHPQSSFTDAISDHSHLESNMAIDYTICVTNPPGKQGSISPPSYTWFGHN